MKPTYRQAARRIAVWIVTLAAVGFFIDRILANASHMPSVTWGLTGVCAAVASVLLGFTAIVLAALAWHVLLADQRVRLPVATVLPVFLVSQFGKYLPGNVGQFVGRVVLARDVGIAAPTSLATMVTEALWNMGTALGVSALAMYVFLGARLTALPQWMDTTGLGLCFVALLAAPWLGITLLRRLFPTAVAKVFAGSELRPPSWPAALKVSVIYIGGYICLGLALDLQARSLFGGEAAPLLQVSGFFALAWLAGYLLPGAPAGLGVRESVMLLLLAPLYGESTAVALGITLRLATTSADALAFAAGWCWRALAKESTTHGEN